MKPVNVVEGRAYPFGAANVDTDVIIPARYMKAVTRDGLGHAAFETLKARGDTVFSDPRYKSAPILIAGKNFGCGSSREHAVWALMDMGIRAIIAESYSDIFSGNAAGNGLLLVAVDHATIGRLKGSAESQELRIDLENRRITTSAGDCIPFDINPVLRQNLLHGLDPIGLTLCKVQQIEDYEIAHNVRVELS